ncbi:GNAT family N-acetyltransferase [Paractinoplanes lichenicola]|uniref:GNAT family N-acetyltransferase n=1 Tax=Paractinoplanes lichenicola TaxID=2802976 RepID=A0ABS1VFA6_9ACTN|nr:GNAT family N-acetyltransferase [Actinoplanes lichenicola]MBL7253388.1 GNAT family N-acetyltransferase [Actinoplanes lichenicola]
MTLSTARLSVRTEIPESWDGWIGSAPVTLRRRWISLADSRIPGGARTFALPGPGGDQVALVGGVMEGPTGHVRFDPQRVLSGGSVADGVVADGPHPWQGRPAEQLFPACVLMGTNYESAPVGPGARDPRVLRAYLEAQLDWCRDQGVRSVSALFLRPDYPEFLDVLREAGFTVVPMVDRSDMDVTWDDLDGYIAGLRRNQRFAVRRELREIAARGIEIRERPIEAEEPDLLPLRAQLVTKYGGVPDARREADSFRHLRDHFGPENVWIVEARKRGALLSFAMLVRDGDQWTVLMSGTDYTHPDASFTYFATVFYRPAELAPAQGITTIAYGLGTVQAKKLRGCTVSMLSAAGLLLDRPD